MSIDENIKEICVNAFPNFSFIFEDWYNADRALAKAKKMPAILLLLPSGGNVTLDLGRRKDAEDVAIAFVDKVKRDANGAEQSLVYNEMKLKAFTFVQQLNASKKFEPIDSFEYTTIIDQTGTIVTGVMLTFRLKEAEGVCYE